MTQGDDVAENVLAVPIGEIIVSDKAQDVLVAYGLGSCVAVCVYDPVARVGGMLHALLPEASNPVTGTKRQSSKAVRQAKFVDQGVPMLVEAVSALGGRCDRLIVRLCGGAQVLSAPGFENERLRIGERNVLAAENVLEMLGLKIKAQDTGGTIGRTVRMYIADGQVMIRSLGRGEQALDDAPRTGR